MESDAIKNLPGAGQRHQDVDQAKAVAGERDSQPDMWHVETEAARSPLVSSLYRLRPSDQVRIGYVLTDTLLRRCVSYAQNCG